MSMECGHRRGFRCLELLLVSALVALAFQLVPSLWFALLRAVDPRHWSAAVWVGLNVAIVLALVGVRFGPGLLDDWRQRAARLAAEVEKRQQRLRAQEQRAMFQRLRQGRKSRIY